MTSSPPEPSPASAGEGETALPLPQGGGGSGWGWAASSGVLAGTGIVLLLLLTLAPGLDLWISGWFYRAGEGFFLGRWLPFRIVYGAVPLLAWGFAVILVLGLLLTTLSRPQRWGAGERAMLFLLLSLIVGPGLLTNTLLKDHWGRARPAQVTEFGGPRAFTPALEPADQCDHNCSFPAGHAAMAFYPLSMLFLSPRRRPRMRLALVGFGLLVGVVRIAQGGHFLSDVIAAGLVVAGTAWVLDRWLASGEGRLLPALWQALRRIGHAARSAIRFGWWPPWRRVAVLAALFALLLVASFTWADLPLMLQMQLLDPGVVAFFGEVTQLGVSTGWLVGSGVVAILLWLAAGQEGLHWLKAGIRRWRDRAAFFFLSVAASGLLTDLIKIILGRARPRLYLSEQLYGFTWFAGRSVEWSMPSGHATTIAAVATALAVIWPRHVAAFALVAVLVAASRILVSVHYLSDVMLGAAIGVGVTLLLARRFERWGLALRPPSAIPLEAVELDD